MTEQHAAELARRRVAAATSRQALTIALRSMERAEMILGQCQRMTVDLRELDLAREDLIEAIHIARTNLREAGR